MTETDIVTLFTKLGSQRVRPSGNNITVSCPLAPWTHKSHHDRSPSMSVKVNSMGPSVFICYACNARGSLTHLLYELRRFGYPVEDLIPLVKEQEAVDLPAVIEQSFAAYGPEYADRAKKANFDVWDESEAEPFKGKVPRYVLKRGVSLDTCREWGLGYDESAKRLVFPIRRKDGKLVGLVGRAVLGRIEPKYKNYWNFTKSQYVYGEHMVDDQRPVDPNLPGAKALVIVEGMFDVLKLWTIGYRRVVSLMGSYASTTQVEKILATGLDVYTMLDFDLAGEKGRRHLWPMLEGRVPVFDVPGPKGKDPDDLTREELLECLSKARFV